VFHRFSAHTSLTAVENARGSRARHYELRWLWGVVNKFFVFWTSVYLALCFSERSGETERERVDTTTKMNEPEGLRFRRLNRPQIIT